MNFFREVVAGSAAVAPSATSDQSALTVNADHQIAISTQHPKIKGRPATIADIKNVSYALSGAVEP
jgi:hypothetical protein